MVEDAGLVPPGNQETGSGLTHARSREMLVRHWLKAQESLTAFILVSVPQFSDAEDLVQEVAAEVALRFDDYDSSRPFLPWALWVAKLKIADFYRARQRGQVVLLGESIDALAEACTRIQDRLTDDRMALERCLAQLTDRSRALLHLRYFEDLKPQEISVRLGMTAPSVRVALSKIRAVLKECVQTSLGKVAASNG